MDDFDSEAWVSDKELRIAALADRFCDRLGKSEQSVRVFLKHNEFELALEELAGSLAREAAPIDDDERTELLRLADEMRIGHAVPRFVAKCPRRT